MKWWKQWVIGFFSLCAVVVYVQSEIPAVTVSSTYQKGVQLYFVNDYELDSLADKHGS